MAGLQPRDLAQEPAPWQVPPSLTLLPGDPALSQIPHQYLRAAPRQASPIGRRDPRGVIVRWGYRVSPLREHRTDLQGKETVKF